MNKIQSIPSMLSVDSAREGKLKFGIVLQRRENTWTSRRTRVHVLLHVYIRALCFMRDELITLSFAIDRAWATTERVGGERELLSRDACSFNANERGRNSA